MSTTRERVNMLKLRPYQEDQAAGVRSLLAQGLNRPAVVAATGLGKTIVEAALISDHIRGHPRDRVLGLVHRDELAQQLRNKVHAWAPHLRPGIVMGNQRDHDRQVVIASTQTLGRTDRYGRNARRDQIHSVGMIIYDECHHAAAPSSRAILSHYGASDGVPTIGFTATMGREDGRGLGEIWQAVVKRPDDPDAVWDTLWGVRNGYLADPRGIRVKVPQLDLSGVHIRAGDLQQDETAAAMLDADTGSAIVRFIHDILTPKYGQRRGVVFSPNVATALDFAETMNAAGIRTGVILGSTPKDERGRLFEAFRTGELEWLCNAMVLTEGWDAPWCDALIIARPTRSAGLYQQMIGRGLRLFDGKQDCIVADVCGVTELHGLAGICDLSEDRKVKPRDEQSLLEALDEFEGSDDGFVSWDEEFKRITPVHKVVGTEIDLFGNSHSVWLKTRAGTPFIPAGDQIFFLWPNGDGLFNLGRTAKIRPESNLLLHEDPHEFSIAAALLEQYASAYDPSVTGRDAPWRQTGLARPGQKLEMEAWGIEVPRKLTAAQAYDSLNVAMASTRLDPR
jgi:superfamily II DNA or RNA helicase